MQLNQSFYFPEYNSNNIFFPKAQCPPKVMASFIRDADILSMTKEAANEIDPNDFWKAIPLWLQPSETWTHFNILGVGSISRTQLQWCVENGVQMGPLRLVKWVQHLERGHFRMPKEWIPQWNPYTLAVFTGRLDKIDFNHPHFKSILSTSDSNFGATLLQLASGAGQYEIVAALLAAGADVNGVGTGSKTLPVKLAFINGDLEILSLLIEKGGYVNGENPHRWFPLIEAVKSKNLEIVKLLLPKISNINQTDIHGNTALIYASNLDDAEIMNVLIASGADINAKNNEGDTALLIATSRGGIKVFYSLIDRVKDINHKNNVDITTLYLAARIGNVEMVQALLLRNADPNIADKNKVTPLMTAIKNKHKKVFDLLIDHVKDLNYTDLMEQTALDYACGVANDLDMIKELLKKGANINAVNETGSDNHRFDPPIEKEFINEKDLELCTQNRLSSLHTAAVCGRLAIIDLLLKSGAKKVDNVEDSIELLKILSTSQPKTSKEYYVKLSKIPLDEKVLSPARQHLQTISLSHLFKIKKPFLLFPLKKEDGKIHCVKNANFSSYWLGKILRSNELMREKFPDQAPHADLLKDTFTHTLNHLDGDNKKILERIQENKPTFLITGFNNHAVSIVAWGKFFILSETSGMTAKPFQIFTYNQKKLDLPLLNLILDYTFRGEEHYKNLFSNMLPNLLNLEENNPNSVLHYIEEQSPIQYQTSPNCTYACVEGAVWGLSILDTLMNNPHEASVEHWNTIIQTEINHFEFWQNFSEAYHLERYLDTRLIRQPKEKSMKRLYKLDNNLINSAFLKTNPIVDQRLTQLFEELKDAYKSKYTSHPDLFFSSI